jgi:hypothetical protein
MSPEIPAPLLGPGMPQEPAVRKTAVPAAARPRHARPGPGRRQVWLPTAAGGLGVLAGAAATVSYAAERVPPQVRRGGAGGARTHDRQIMSPLL